MKKLFSCKLLSMLLALTLLFAGAVSLKPTPKANADEYIASTIRAFTIASLDDLEIVDEETGNHLCLIVDSNLLTEENEIMYAITSTTTINDINDSTFMQTLAEVLTDTVGAPPIDHYLNEDGIYDCEAIIGDINMDLLIYRSTNNYLNLSTGNTVGISDTTQLISNTSTTYNSIIYGLMWNVPTPQSMYMLLFKIESSGDFRHASFHTSQITSNVRHVHFIVHDNLLF